jgi:hypothetical protein
MPRTNRNPTTHSNSQTPSKKDLAWFMYSQLHDQVADKLLKDGIRDVKFHPQNTKAHQKLGI